MKAGDPPSGSVVDKSRPFAGTEHAPILLCFRPFDARVGGVSKDQLSVTGTENIKGVECTLVERALGTNRLRYAVDPLRQFVIVQQTLHSSNGGPRYQIDIDYQQDPTHGWLTKGWRFVTFAKDGVIRTTHSATILSYEINLSLDDDDFSLEFPPGSHVADTVEGIGYVVRPDGSRRIVSRSPSKQSPDGYANTKWIFLGIGAAVIIAIWAVRQHVRK
jgi:hypothetical protein